VRVFYPHAKYPRWADPQSKTRKRLDPSFRPEEVDVSYHEFPAIPLVSRPVNGWLAARALIPAVREFEPDILFGCFLYPDSFAALRIARCLRKPVVAMSIGSDLNRVGDWASARLTRTVLEEADYVVTVSAALRERAIAKGASESKTVSIVNGCDREVFHVRSRMSCRVALDISLDADVVLYVGRLDRRKGLLELVEAAATLHHRRPGIRFYLIGDGPDRSAIAAAVMKRGASGYIHLAGGCSFEEVALWLGAADVVTLPSYMEGCPNVLLEALACGRPVVATSVGGIPEIVTEECGRLVRPGDAAGLANALSVVLNQTWDAATISSGAGRGWESVADELMRVFHTALRQVSRE
jgi:glycosyltransferase involved in cell wall biosynthesis